MKAVTIVFILVLEGKTLYLTVKLCVRIKLEYLLHLDSPCWKEPLVRLLYIYIQIYTNNWRKHNYIFLFICFYLDFVTQKLAAIKPETSIAAMSGTLNQLWEDHAADKDVYLITLFYTIICTGKFPRKKVSAKAIDCLKMKLADVQLIKLKVCIIFNEFAEMLNRNMPEPRANLPQGHGGIFTE